MMSCKFLFTSLIISVVIPPPFPSPTTFKPSYHFPITFILSFSSSNFLPFNTYYNMTGCDVMLCNVM